MINIDLLRLAQALRPQQPGPMPVRPVMPTFTPLPSKPVPTGAGPMEVLPAPMPMVAGALANRNMGIPAGVGQQAKRKLY